MRRLKNAYLNLPPWAHRLLKPALFVFGLARKHELVLLEGPERSGGKPLRIAYAGLPDIKESVIKRAFGSGAAERSLGKVPVWRSSEAIAALAPEADLVIRHVPAAYEGLTRRGVLARLPAWVKVEIDLKDEACGTRGKEKRGRIRNKAKREGYAFGVARQESEFAEFYDRMHVPYVRDRHGDASSIQSREETLAALRGGGWELLTVSKDGVMVAGGTVQFAGDAARFWQIGIRDADPALLQAGAADAVYHHMLGEAAARGCRIMNLGHSRPFVRDGVLEYKRLLGGYVVDQRDERRGLIELSVPRPGPATADFLEENAMIALDPDGRYRLYGFVRDAGQAEERARWWSDRYAFKGTLDVRVLTADGGAPTE